MLDPMQKDAAIELAATLRANIYRYEQRFGETQQTENDDKTVIAFKHRVRFEDEKMDWEEVLNFSRIWMARYPDDPMQAKQDVA